MKAYDSQLSASEISKKVKLFMEYKMCNKNIIIADKSYKGYKPNVDKVHRLNKYKCV